MQLAPEKVYTPPKAKPVYEFFKRFFDIVLCVFALIVLSPLFLVVAILRKGMYNNRMDTLKYRIATNITELRKAHNLTQAELAARLNYSDKSISKWERGESLPDIGVLKPEVYEK